MRKRAVLLGLLALGIAMPCFAQQKSSGRPATREDLVGAWSLVRLSPNIPPPPPENLDPDFMPHQVWVFTPGGKFVKVSRVTPFQLEEFDKLVPSITGDEKALSTRFEVFPDRAALMLYPAASSPFVFSAFIVTVGHKDEKKGVDIRPGDALLDMYTPDGKKLIIGHHFRKIKQ